jgi:hypothetical protein
VSSWVSTLCPLVAAGVTDPGDVDIFTALIGGLLTQQQRWKDSRILINNLALLQQLGVLPEALTAATA